jgi:hypothetical protein
LGKSALRLVEGTGSDRSISLDFQEQCRRARNRFIVVDNEHDPAAVGVRDHLSGRRRPKGLLGTVASRHAQREAGALSRRRFDFETQIEQIGDAADDRKPESEAFLSLLSDLRRLIELLEDQLQLVGRNPDARV